MGEWAKLRILNLSYNSLGAASGFSIGRLLDKTRELQELFLEHCGLSSLTLQPNSGLLESVKSEWVCLGVASGDCFDQTSLLTWDTCTAFTIIDATISSTSLNTIIFMKYSLMD